MSAAALPGRPVARPPRSRRATREPVARPRRSHRPHAAPLLRRALAALVALAVGAATAWWYAQREGIAEPVGTMSAADVLFLRDLLTVQTTTADVLERVEGRVEDEQLASLAAAIAATEADERATAQRWLAEAPVTAKAATEHGGQRGDHAHAGPAVADERILAELSRSTGTQLRTLLSTVLLAHQQASAELAEDALGRLRDPEVKAYAERVVGSRRGQVQILLTLQPQATG